MHRNMFREPRPNNRTDMELALRELDYCLEGSGSHAIIDPPDPKSEGTIFQGWIGQAADDFGREFETAGYPEREALLIDLRACGFLTFEDREGNDVG